MFLLNSLYNKCFAMNTSFRISLLYLLLIIPHHGNSPLPVMESWLQKDQDDGFVQRDMTSSLTGGDESFGSAHQTYQNSLIRKKKSDSTGLELPTKGYRRFTSKCDRAQRFQQPNVFFDGRFINDDYSAQLSDSERNEAMLDEFERSSGMPSDKYRSKSSSANLRNPNEASFSSRFSNKYGSDKYVDIVPSKDVLLYNNRMVSNLRDDSDRSSMDEDAEGNSKWSMCKRMKERYVPNPPMGFPQTVPLKNTANPNFGGGVSLQDRYQNIDDDRRGRQISNQEYKEDFQVNTRPEGKNPQIFDENDYYDAEMNPIGVENSNARETDYSQMLPDHTFMHKRDETRQQAGDTGLKNTNGQSGTSNALQNRNQVRSLKNDATPLESSKEDMKNSGQGKVREIKNFNSKNSDGDLIWKLNSNLQSKALNDVMKSSQRALQEVQLIQQKVSSGNEGYRRESREEPFLKCEKKNINIDERRNKREDEDEQKNMKTGTDEGGGGEYEDEEGKGHKDEEEYYEDADLSDDESGNEIRTTDELNQKYVKREAAEGGRLKDSKEERNDNSQDYELSLDNAPVENSEKSRKSSLHGEGEKTKKNSVRKGVKIWDQWGKWSPCSVTCGVGRSTRWRHCIGGGCAQGEKEAQIKRCTNPACK